MQFVSFKFYINTFNPFFYHPESFHYYNLLDVFFAQNTRSSCNVQLLKAPLKRVMPRLQNGLTNSLTILFQPSLANKKSCGLSQLIYYSVLKCDENIRSELVNNITLSGGNTKFPGFEKRLYQELVELFDEKTNIKVRALPNRDLLGWVGAAR